MQAYLRIDIPAPHPVQATEIRDLKINPSGVVDRLAREDLVVTRRGKPAAALVYLDGDLLDEYILLHHPTLLVVA